MPSASRALATRATNTSQHMALPRIESQRFHRPNTVERLNQKRALRAFRNQDRVRRLAVSRQHQNKPPDDQSRSARTTNVMTGLKKNMTGRKKMSVVESSSVPNN